MVRGQWALELGIGEFRRHLLGHAALVVLGAVTMVLGIIIIIGALLISKGLEREGAVTVIAFSVLSIFTGGGYLVGLIIGVIGGAVVLSKTQSPKMSEKRSSSLGFSLA
jgi:membrane-anchored glycerophosphoryl diester phosphodiesterase (GDPDase)